MAELWRDPFALVSTVGSIREWMVGGPESAVMRSRFALVLTVGIVLAGCTDDGSSPPATAGSYALAHVPGWELRDAADLGPDDPIAAIERPPLDWYAEYVDSSSSESIRLSGHDATLADAQAALEAVGFGFEDATVAGRDRAVVGRSTIEDGGPSLVLLAADGRTVILLSYEVTAQGLTDFAGSVVGASEADWIAAGGIVP